MGLFFKRMPYLGGSTELFQEVNKELNNGDLANVVYLYF